MRKRKIKAEKWMINIKERCCPSNLERSSLQTKATDHVSCWYTDCGLELQTRWNPLGSRADILYAYAFYSIQFHNSLMTYRFLICLIFLNNILVFISEEQWCQVLDDDSAAEREKLKFKTWIKAKGREETRRGSQTPQLHARNKKVMTNRVTSPLLWFSMLCPSCPWACLCPLCACLHSLVHQREIIWVQSFPITPRSDELWKQATQTEVTM